MEDRYSITVLFILMKICSPADLTFERRDALNERSTVIYLRELQVFLVYEERRYQLPIYYHIELRYTTDSLSWFLFSGDPQTFEFHLDII